MAVVSWIVFLMHASGDPAALLLPEQATLEDAAEGVWRIRLRYVLPNIMAPILVVAGFQLERLILLEATLSFLGLRVGPRARLRGAACSPTTTAI